MSKVPVLPVRVVFHSRRLLRLRFWKCELTGRDLVLFARVEERSEGEPNVVDDIGDAMVDHPGKGCITFRFLNATAAPVGVNSKKLGRKGYRITVSDPPPPTTPKGALDS